MTNLRINRELFTRVNVDSGSLSQLSAVIHRFAEPGEYECIVMRGAAVTRRFAIAVSRDGGPGAPASEKPSARQPAAGAANNDSNAAAPQQPAAGQVSIDLRDTAAGPGRFSLRAGGYAMFHVSAGPGGYAVEIRRPDKGGTAKVFDSRELKDGDMFSTMVIRPGTYSVINALQGSARAELVVSYPELGKTQRNLPPVSVECAQNQISPGRIRVEPSQGLVFTLKAPSRIKIELTRPEDRPPRLRARAELAAREKAGKKPVRRYRLMPAGGAQAARRSS